MSKTRSEQIFLESNKYIPGGVNSPVRAFSSVGIPPVIAESAHGSHLTDVEGNTYIDYICSWGPLIFGHSPDFVTEGIEEVAKRGTTFGLPTEYELEMAKLICQSYPGLDMVRMVNSGTEATMSAIRIARGVTGRSRIVKFEGCYHGHNDALLVQSGSGMLTFGVPTSPGIPEAITSNTLVCRYNDCHEIKSVFDSYGQEIACVIVEPIAGNMGLIPGTSEFLSTLRSLCDDHGAILIFDEVISGFRAALGGAAEYYNIIPDMVCFGKIIGAGLPVGAYGGKREIMACVSPSGPIYQAGTLSGNPLALSAGIKVIDKLRSNSEYYATLDKMGRELSRGIEDNIKKLSAPCRVVQCGSLLTMFFTENVHLESFDDVKNCNTELYAKYFQAMLKQGILLPPSQFECMFLSLAHSKEDIRTTVEANYYALKEVF